MGLVIVKLDPSSVKLNRMHTKFSAMSANLLCKNKPKTKQKTKILPIISPSVNIHIENVTKCNACVTCLPLFVDEDTVSIKIAWCSLILSFFHFMPIVIEFTSHVNLATGQSTDTMQQWRNWEAKSSQNHFQAQIPKNRIDI